MTKKPIPYGRQCIDADDIEAVKLALTSDYLTQGPLVEQFERALADYCGAKYALALSNGTAALHLANLALGVAPGDEVVTSPITFVASANSTVYAGGRPGLVDIDPATFNMDPACLKEHLAGHPDVRGVVAVHMAGYPAAMEAIAEIARERDLWVIEDACHALGSRWRGKDGSIHRVGACSHSDLTVFSFHPVKQLAAGEGGAILTNSQSLYEKCLLLRSHGITKAKEKMGRYDGPWYYEMQELGYNFRITDFQCALALSQLKKLDGWIAKRRAIVEHYDRELADIAAIRPQHHPANAEFSYHLYATQAERRNELFAHLQGRGILAQVHYIPVHLQPYYQKTFAYKRGDFPKAEAYYEKAISLPLFPSLGQAELDEVVEAVRSFYRVG